MKQLVMEKVLVMTTMNGIDEKDHLENEYLSQDISEEELKFIEENYFQDSDLVTDFLLGGDDE